MALDDEWYPWDEATLSDPTPIRILLEAVRERASVVSWHHSRWLGHLMDVAPHEVPNLDVLDAIRAEIRALAPHFVQMSHDSYALHSWRNFPVMLSPRDDFDGSRALSILPVCHVPEPDPEGLRLYRAFLASCAAWLARFRYFRGDAAAYCTKSLEDPEFSASSESDEMPGGLAEVLGSVSYRTLDPPVHGIPHFSAFISYHGTQFGSTDYSSENWSAWKNKIEQSRSVVARLSGQSGLHVRNAAGIDADCVLVPCGGTSSSNGYGEISVSAGTVVDPTLFRYDDGMIFGAFGSGRMEESESYRISESLNRSVLMNYSFTSQEGLKINDGVAKWTMVKSWQEFATSEDLLRRVVTRDDYEITPRSSLVGGMGTPFGATAERGVSLRVADSMGIEALGSPIIVGTIPAHGDVAVGMEIEGLSPNTGLLDRYFFVPDFDPCAHSNCTASASYDCRFFPILDYGPHFKFRPAADENTET